MLTRGKVCKYVSGRNEESENPSIICEDNQGTISLANNRQVGICTKHIDIRHHFLWDISEDKDVDINYIPSEDNPAYIRKNNI